MLTYADVCWRKLTYAAICGRMLAYADVCGDSRKCATPRLVKMLKGGDKSVLQSSIQLDGGAVGGVFAVSLGVSHTVALAEWRLGIARAVIAP